MKQKSAYWALFRCHHLGDFVFYLQISPWWRWAMPSDNHPYFTTWECEKVSAWPTTSSSTVILIQTLCSHWRYFTCLLNICFRPQSFRDTSPSSRKNKSSSICLWKDVIVSQIIKQLIYYIHDFSKEGSLKLWAMLPEKIKLSRITFFFLLNKIYQNLHAEELCRIN